MAREYDDGFPVYRAMVGKEREVMLDTSKVAPEAVGFYIVNPEETKGEDGRKIQYFFNKQELTGVTLFYGPALHTVHEVLSFNWSTRKIEIYRSNLNSLNFDFSGESELVSKLNKLSRERAGQILRTAKPALTKFKRRCLEAIAQSQFKTDVERTPVKVMDLKPPMPALSMPCCCW